MLSAKLQCSQRNNGFAIPNAGYDLMPG